MAPLAPLSTTGKYALLRGSGIIGIGINPRTILFIGATGRLVSFLLGAGPAVLDELLLELDELLLELETLVHEAVVV